TLVAFIGFSTGSWRWAFVATGAIGFVWLAFWLVFYRVPQQHPRVSPEELAHIESDPPDPVTKIRWLKLLPYRQTWAFAIGKFLTDPIWWFYAYWLPKIVQKQFPGTEPRTVAAAIFLTYLIADIGSIGGGWLSSSLIKRGWTVNAARKTAMLLCAFLAA